MATDAAASSLLGKRKKRVVIKNQFFLHHVRQMRDTAVSKNWQSKHNYAKMVRALERYPLPLETPRACLILEGFGQKTCELLEKRLADYAQEMGVTEAEALRLGNENFASEKSLKPKIRKVARRASELESTQLTPPPPLPEATSSATISSNNQSNSNGNSNSNNSSNSNSNSNSSASYKPRQRSGATALLVALLHNGGCTMAKAELIRAAQPLCDSSFTVAEAGSSHYTAWSAMGQLVRRGLATRTGSGAASEYGLTAAGVAVATELAANAENCRRDSGSPPAAAAAPAAAAPAAAATVHRISDSEEEEELQQQQQEQQQQQQQQQPGFSFTFCSGDFQPVGSRQLAARRRDELLDCDTLLVACSYEQLLRTGLHYELEVAALGQLPDGQVAAYMRDRDLLEVYQPPASQQPLAQSLTSAAASNNGLTLAAASNNGLTSAAASNNGLTSAAASNNGLTLAAASNNGLTSAAATDNGQSGPGISALSAPPLVSSRSLARQQQQRHGSCEEPKLLYTIEAGQFEIVFCLDNREHFGMGSVKQMLLPSLLRNHIKCEVRPLQVADFLWIARCQKTGREAVLNILVERKRLDDLAQSIKDGRFREQKFRLRRSGISQLVLLVEHFGSGRGHVRMPEETLRQAACNSQLIDGCVVKHAASAQHTVSYLSLLTAKLGEMYRGRRLIVNDRAAADSAARVPLLPLCRHACVVDFKEFNRMAVKSKRLELREMLAKQLLQLAGVTMEKAFAIVQQFPTVQALVAAYAGCQSDAERRELLSGICYDRLFDKRIGDSISRSVFANFCRRPPPDDAAA